MENVPSTAGLRDDEREAALQAFYKGGVVMVVSMTTGDVLENHLADLSAVVRGVQNACRRHELRDLSVVPASWQKFKREDLRGVRYSNFLPSRPNSVFLWAEIFSSPTEQGD